MHAAGFEDKFPSNHFGLDSDCNKQENYYELLVLSLEYNT